MDHATGAMGSLLLKLGDLIVGEYKLQIGVKEDVEYMKRELTSMYIALRKVGDIPRDQLDLQVKSWADEVRDLSYMMEDIIDKFLVRVEGAEPAVKPRKLKRLMEKMGDLFTKSKTRHEISEEIKGIKARVQEAADRHDRYKVNDVVANPAAATIADPRLLALYKDKKDLVGIDGPLNELTNMLLSDGHGDVEKQLKVVSIFGFGGLGKTTLAKALFDKLQSPFDCSAFVPVGRNPIIKELLNNILFEIDKQKQPELNEKQLIDKLRGLLESKRYLIIIDDIWDIKTWEIIRCALVHNSSGSRIITTTRILDVARKTGEVYRLKSLSDDLSKELFHRRLSGANIENISDLPTEVYNKILHKCGGVPLAIITIASLLDNKPVEFWSKIYNSIGFGHEVVNNDVDNTRKILLYSYYDLPCHLRTCLLHLSIYPEDRLIEKDSLIWLWVGEGFIQEEPGLGLFEIGERYFNELLNRSMLLPVENPDKCIISGCRIHDVVLDMICLLVKEENFVTILDSNKQYTSVHTNARRLVIGKGEEAPSAPMIQVRSFNAIDSADKVPSLSCFKVLRVLNIEESSSSTTPHLEHLGKLVYLRYLGIALENIRVPEEIGYLKFLQVLNLAGPTKLPQSISLLNQLKCLKAKRAYITVEQDWIGKLTSLEVLWVRNVNSSSNFATELGKLTELRRLQIHFLYLGSVSLVKAWAGSLVKLQKIQVIYVEHIYSMDTCDVTLEGYVPPQQLRVFNLPHRQPGMYASIKTSWLPNLSHLSLRVDSPDVEIFGRFPGLVSLSLDRPVQGHYVMGGAGVGLFPKLRVYKTSATPGQFLPGAMPSLEVLKFRVDVWTSRDGNIEFDFGSLLSLPMLQKVAIWMWSGRHITDEDWQKAEETVTQGVDSHPNHPTIHLNRNRGYMQILDNPDAYGV